MGEKEKDKPGTIDVNGEVYNLKVLHVQEFHDDGRPKIFRIIYDDENVKLSEDQEKNQFLLVYIKPQHLLPERM